MFEQETLLVNKLSSTKLTYSQRQRKRRRRKRRRRRRRKRKGEVDGSAMTG